jgi:hypothetical protein
MTRVAANGTRKIGVGRPVCSLMSGNNGSHLHRANPNRSSAIDAVHGAGQGAVDGAAATHRPVNGYKSDKIKHLRTLAELVDLAALGSTSK